MTGDGRQRVLVISGNEITDQRLMARLATDPSYEPVWFDPLLLSAGKRKASAPTPSMKSTDLVVNCVAGSPNRVLTTTRVLLDAARRTPPRRIVYLSSMAVYSGSTGLVDEETPLGSPLNAYAKARMACENLVHQYTADGGDAVIVRPTCVFGPGSEAWGGRIARLLESRRLGDLGQHGDGVCNLVFVDDLIALIIATLSAPDITGQTFNARSEWPRSTWNEFLIHFARAIGATPVQRLSERRLQAEVKIFAPLLRAMGLVAQRSGAASLVPDAITPSLLHSLRQDITISAAKTAARFGIASTPFEQVMSATAHWWRSRGTGAPVTRDAIYMGQDANPLIAREEASR